MIHGQKEFVDEEARSYILVEPYLEYTEIDQLISNKFECLKHPFPDAGSWIDADEYITDLSQRMIKSYGAAISKYAGFEFSEIQWTTVLCEYFRGSLNDIYYRFKKILQLRESAQQDEIEVYTLGLLSYDHEPALADSMRNIVSDYRKNAYLWSYMADAMGIKVFEPAYVDPVMDGSDKARQRHFMRRLVRVATHPSKIIRRIKNDRRRIKKLDKKSRVLLYETLLPLDVEEEFCTRSGGLINMIKPAEAKRENLRIINRYGFDADARKEVLGNAFQAENEFERIANEFMLLSMPIAYFEASNEMYKMANEIVKTWDLRRIYSSYTSMELMDYCFAIVRINGTKIYGIQHSGAYGGSSFSPQTEMVFSDVFCSWGWTYKGASYVNSTIKPVKMIRLPKFQKEEIVKKDKILWACNFPLMGNIGRCWDYSDYMKNEMEFIDDLDDEIRNIIVFRIDDSNLFNKKFAEKLHSKYKNIKIESRYDISFSESVRESRFVISDYHGSPDLESLLLGVPVVMFRADGNPVPSPCYMDGTKMLRDLGVFSESAKMMAETINKHKGSEDWLLTDEAGKAYSQYLKVFTGLDHKLDEFTINEIYDTWYEEFADCIKS